MTGIAEGLVAGQLLSLALEHQPSIEKFGDKIADEVLRVVAKHDHVGVSCETADCPNAVNDRRRAKTDQETEEFFDRFQAAMHQYDWHPRTGRSERALVAAHLRIARRHGRREYTLSCREAAEVANLCRDTALKRTRDAQHHGWIAPVVSRRRRKEATRWRLRADNLRPYSQDPKDAQDPRDPLNFVACEYGRDLPPDADDVFSHRGLGEIAEQVYLSIRHTPLTPKEVVVIVGCHLRTVQRCLRRLEECRLASSANGKWSALDRDWVEVAKELGAHGVGAGRKEKPQNERQANANRLQAVDKVKRGRLGRTGVF